MLKRLTKLMLTLLIAATVFSSVAFATSFEEDMLYWVNYERMLAGCDSVALDYDLCRVAMLRAMECQDKQDASHKRPDKREFYTAFWELNVVFKTAKENTLSATNKTAKEMVALWMKSTSGHRETIIDPDLEVFGCAQYTNSNGRTFAVQEFAKGKSVVPGISEQAGGWSKYYQDVTGKFPGVTTPATGFATPEPVVTTAYEPVTVVVGDPLTSSIKRITLETLHTTENTKLYKAASTKSTKLASIPKYTLCSIYDIVYNSKGNAASYFLVSYNGQMGYVRAAHVDLDVVYGKAAKKAKVYTEPSTSANVVATIAKNTRFAGTYLSDGWYRITTRDSIIGYVTGAYIKNFLA